MFNLFKAMKCSSSVTHKTNEYYTKTLSGERAAYFKMTTSGVFVSLFTSAQI